MNLGQTSFRGRRRGAVIALEQETQDAARDRPAIDGADSESMPNKNRAQIEDPRARLFREIKAYFFKKRQSDHEGIAFEQMKTKVRETLLRNISQKYRACWKLMQNKYIILSLVRMVIKDRRRYGMKPAAACRNFGAPAKTAAEPSKYLISKQSRVFRLHLSLLVGYFVYFMIYFPLNIAFRTTSHSRVHLVLHILCHGYFGLDVLLRFLIAVKSHGKVLTCHKAVSRAYLRSYFLLDLISALPFDLMLSEADHSLRLLMFFLCLLKVCFSSMSERLNGDVIEEYCQKLVKSKKLRNLLGILAFLGTVVHVSSCIWVGLIRLDQESNWYSIK